MICYVNKRNSYTRKHESSMRDAEFALEAKRSSNWLIKKESGSEALKFADLFIPDALWDKADIAMQAKRNQWVSLMPQRPVSLFAPTSTGCANWKDRESRKTVS